MTLPDLVDLTELLTTVPLSGEARVRLLLLDEDLRSAQLAFSDYRDTEQALAAIVSRGTGFEVSELHTLRSRLFHYAKTYVCAMRRYARTLEALSAARSLYPRPAAAAIRLSWRKKKAALRVFTGPRDAIEHMDDRLQGRQRWVLLNFRGASLAVTESASERAPLSERDLLAAVSARNDIVEALRTAHSAPTAG